MGRSLGDFLAVTGDIEHAEFPGRQFSGCEEIERVFGHAGSLRRVDHEEKSSVEIVGRWQRGIGLVLERLHRNCFHMHNVIDVLHDPIDHEERFLAEE